MIRNIIILTLNDLAIAFKNKTIYVILFIPFFVFFSLKLVDRTDGNFKQINIGLIKEGIYPPVILKAIQSADRVFRISHVCN